MAKYADKVNKKTIAGKIEKVLFLDAKSGRTILSVIQEDGRECRVIGTISGIEKGSVITATGSWGKDEKYGWQFLAESIEEVRQGVEEQESADDGLMHAHDFSNVLNKKLKQFRNITQEHEDDYYEESGELCDPDNEDAEVSGHEQNPLTDKVEVEWDDILVQDGYLLVMKDGVTTNLVGRETLGIRITGKNKRAYIANIRHNGVRAYMGDIIKRVTDSLPKLTICFQKGLKPYLENKEALDEAIAIIMNNRIVRIEEVDWNNSSLWDGYFFLSCMTGNSSFTLEDDRAKPFMNKILKRVACNLPTLRVRTTEGQESELIDENVLDEVIAIIKGNIIRESVEIDWREVRFEDHNIQLKDPSGEAVNIRYWNAMAFMNKMLKRMADYLPRLVVRFEEGKDPVIENSHILDDITTILTQRKDYGALIRSNIESSDVLKALSIISKKGTRLFVPRDMSPYIDFLSEHQAIDAYPIVPIDEYIGGSYEEGALFTVMMNGRPCIVWENFKDSRSTYVFDCSESDYEEKRQQIYDYIVTEESNKRQFLRKDECEQIFGKKPRMIVHNNLTSWSEKLMTAGDSDEPDVVVN